MSDHLRGFFRLVGAAIFEVAVGWEVGRRGDDPPVVDDLVGADRPAAPDVRQAEARRRQRLEAERGQKPRRAGIPRVGNDEGAGPPVQLLEYRRLFDLCAHLSLLMAYASSNQASRKLPVALVHRERAVTPYDLASAGAKADSIARPRDAKECSDVLRVHSDRAPRWVRDHHAEPPGKAQCAELSADDRGRGRAVRVRGG